MIILDNLEVQPDLMKQTKRIPSPREEMIPLILYQYFLIISQYSENTICDYVFSS